MALLPVADALARVLEGVEPLAIERVALANAQGRVLAEDLSARRTQPPENVSVPRVKSEGVNPSPCRTVAVFSSML